VKINYKIKEVKPNVFAVIVKDKYDRAMLFCRAQEYYESPSPKFRGKNFSIWEYMKWYHEQNHWGFSYGADWSGFNIPLQTVRDCYNKLTKPESPYDKGMDEILNKLKSESKDSYIIGAKDTEGETFKHEVCHALYHTNKNYKKQMDNLTKGLPKRYYNVFASNLVKMGYATKVVDDEIQAYLQYGYEEPKFGAGVDVDVRKEYSDIYKEAAKVFK
jgi:phosphoribosyl-ATP pyrophosphohydrolase